MPESNFGNSGRQSRQSITRPSSLGSLPTGEKEPIYFNCSAHAFSRKTLKDNDNFTVEGAEVFIRKTPRVHPVTYELLFLEDRIKFKGFRPALRNERHRTVPYNQIKGAYTLSNHPNLLVLAIDYKEKGKRKYESFLLSNSQITDRVKSILLMVSEDPENLLRDYESIRQTSMSSSLLPTTTEPLQEVKLPRSLYPVSSSNIHMAEKTTSPGPEVRNVRSAGYHITRSNSPFVQRILNKGTKEDEDRSSERVAIHKTPTKVSRVCHSIDDLELGQANCVEWKLKSSQKRKSLDNSCEIIGDLEYQWPGSVIYLINDGEHGLHVVDNGPIYMFCQREL